MTCKTCRLAGTETRAPRPGVEGPPPHTPGPSHINTTGFHPAASPGGARRSGRRFPGTLGKGMETWGYGSRTDLARLRPRRRAPSTRSRTAAARHEAADFETAFEQGHGSHRRERPGPLPEAFTSRDRRSIQDQTGRAPPRPRPTLSSPRGRLSNRKRSLLTGHPLCF